MNQFYRKRFQKFFHLLFASKLAEHARQNDHNTFSRKRKMLLKDMLLCCLSKKGLNTTFELTNYFKRKKESTYTIISIRIFTVEKAFKSRNFFLSELLIFDFYHSNEPKLWNGYLLLAIDENKAEVPNSKENRRTFRNTNNQHSATDQARTLVDSLGVSEPPPLSEPLVNLAIGETTYAIFPVFWKLLMVLL